jgi:hypothetical protein
MTDEGLRAALEARLGTLPLMVHMGSDYPTQALPKAELLDLLAAHRAEVVDPTRIAEVLADHQLQDGVGKWLGQYRTEHTCDCGAPVVTNAHAEVSLLAARVAHQADALIAAGVFRDSGPVVPDHVHCEHNETRQDDYGATRCTHCGLVF